MLRFSRFNNVLYEELKIQDYLLSGHISTIQSDTSLPCFTVQLPTHLPTLKSYLCEVQSKNMSNSLARLKLRGKVKITDIFHPEG